MKKLVILGLVLVLSIALTSALGLTNICLRDGETVYFSICNSQLEDYTCTETSCQFCANEVSNGIYCPASPNSCNNSCFYIYDRDENSTIILTSPQSYSQLAPGDIQFVVQTSLPNTLDRCDLYINDVRKRYTLTPKETNTFTVKNIDEGTYEWRVECKEKDEYGEDTIISASRILYIEEGAKTQNIILASPQNEEVFTGEQEISFVFNVSSEILNDTDKCILILDNEEASSITDIKLENQIRYNVDVGDYNWKISCNNDEHTSETRAIKVNSIDSSEISDRVFILESWKKKIEDWKEIIDYKLAEIYTKINSLVAKTQDHETRIDALEDSLTSGTNDTIITPNYAKYLSSSERRNIVCGYAIDKHFASRADLGWNCTITYKQTSKGEKSSCKCKTI